MSGLIQGLKEGSKTVFLPVAVDEDGQLIVVLKSGNVVLDGPITVSNQVEVSNDSGNPLPCALAADQLGTVATGVAAPAGASGMFGWLSGIFDRLVRGQKNSAGSLSVVMASDAVSKVSGSSEVATAPTSAPISVSGVDGGGLKRHFRTDTNGYLLVTAAGRNNLGNQAISVSSGSDALLNVPTGAAFAEIQADGASVRITLDGQSPSAILGQRIDDGVMYPVYSSLTAVRLRAQSTACAVQVTYFDRG